MSFKTSVLIWFSRSRGIASPQPLSKEGMCLRGLVRIVFLNLHKVGIDAIAYPKNNMKVGTNESVCPYFLLCGRYYYG